MREVVAVLLVAACGDNFHLIDAPPVVPPDVSPLACSLAHGTTIAMREIAAYDGIATLATSPPDDPRLFVVLREGTIRIVGRDQPFIDLSSVIFIEDTVERGLLGLAFHPNFANNGQFFVFYTTPLDGELARCTVSADPNVANPTCTPILDVLHDRAGNHNGGMLEFGPDGYLYIGTGDGGGRGDPNKRSQDKTNLLGKILRIDVDQPPYAVPADNPFGNEVWMYGLRNPWRWSFDGATGDLWIGDVGQARYEEMDVLHRSEQRGANLGWSIYEGNSCCATQDDLCTEDPTVLVPCDPTGITFPKAVIDRTTIDGQAWHAIIGGSVYRGACYPDIVGHAYYTDNQGAQLADAVLNADDTLSVTLLDGVVSTGPSSLHEGPAHELYMTNDHGHVFHLEAGP